jgi:hypothetical protein
MSMTAVQNSAEVAAAAYRLTTDGAIIQPDQWQADLYALLSQPDPDAANLLLTPTGAGKTEAIVIPSLGLRRGGAPRRLFHISPDGSTLDDALYRLVPYLRAWVAADETPRTLCVEAAEDESDGNQCRRFFPDGSEDPHIVTNPLEADVDLILTTLTRFRALFFGAGGVHALPSALPIADAHHPQRRDLFFFDEAHSYQPDALTGFHRLVEFLYAEDADLIVASTTMPTTVQEEFSFLETLLAPPPKPHCTLWYRPAADPLTEIEARIRRADAARTQVIAVTETSADAETLFARLTDDNSSPRFLYHPEQPAETRRHIYAQLRERDKAGENFLLVTTGEALETSDLNAAVLLTTLCLPENLIRRAGRCHRRGTGTEGTMMMIGQNFSPFSRVLPQAAAYLSALQEQSGHLFEAEAWKAYI